MSGQATLDEPAGDDGEGASGIDPRARAIIDAIESVEQVGDRRHEDGGVVADGAGLDESFGGRLPAFDLPGFGEEPMQDYCMDRERHFCDECGDTFKQARRCGQSRCPECWQSWVVDRAEYVTGRLDTVARVLGGRSGEAHHKHHMGIMLPPDWKPVGDPEERIEATKQVIKRIIRDAWDAEGVAVYHGWSGSGYGDEESPAGGDDRGEWADRLPGGDGEDQPWDEVRDELYRRPHFHAVVVAPTDNVRGKGVVEDVYDRTGWLIKRIGQEDDGRSIDDDNGMEDLASVVTYVHSHASIDTTGDRNELVQVRVGEKFHDSDVTVKESVERSAKRAVRSVAPLTLGVATSSVRCKEQIAPERAPEADEHHTHDHGDDVDVPEPDEGTARVVDANEAAGTVTLALPGGETRTVEAGEAGSLPIGAEVDVDADGEVDLSDPRIECQGAVRHISEAPGYLSSSAWTDRAQRADQLREAWQRWSDDPDSPPP